MGIPETNPDPEKEWPDNYDFSEDEVVLVNEATKKSTGDALAENTDHLKVSKVWGTNGESSTGDTRSPKRESFIGNGSGSFHVVKEIPQWSSDPAILLNASQGLPDNSDGLKYRMLHILPRLVVLKEESSISIVEVVPGGLNDNILANNYTGGNDEEQHTFNPEFLYPGPGIEVTNISMNDWAYVLKFEHVFAQSRIYLYIWVDTNGNLMCTCDEYTGLHNYDYFLLVLNGTYGPQWLTA